MVADRTWQTIILGFQVFRSRFALRSRRAIKVRVLLVIRFGVVQSLLQVSRCLGWQFSLLRIRENLTGELSVQLPYFHSMCFVLCSMLTDYIQSIVYYLILKIILRWKYCESDRDKKFNKIPVKEKNERESGREIL